VDRQLLNPLSDFMPARASPSGFAVSYRFSISPTCGVVFGEQCRNVFSCGVYSTSGTWRVNKKSIKCVSLVTRKKY